MTFYWTLNTKRLSSVFVSNLQCRSCHWFRYDGNMTLTHLATKFRFYNSQIHSKTKGFFMLLGVEKNHWPEMGYMGHPQGSNPQGPLKMSLIFGILLNLEWGFQKCLPSGISSVFRTQPRWCFFFLKIVKG